MTFGGGTRWLYGQPFDWVEVSVSFGADFIWVRFALNVLFWLVVLGGTGVLMKFLYKSNPDLVNPTGAVAGLVFGVVVALAQLWAIPQWSMSTLFFLLGMPARIGEVSAALTLTAIVAPMCLLFARSFRVFWHHSGLAVATSALAAFLYSTFNYLRIRSYI